MIPPTVGRVVWYRRGPNDSHSLFSGGQPHAAMIARVLSDRYVNLAVLDTEGDTHSRTSVRLVQEGELPPTAEPYCEWMPFQKGQAAKTEQLEQKLGASS